jgi:16S rRNA (uracil1498-N3)-methyltransferase
MNIFIAEIYGTEGTLTPEESWHCAKVLRARPGDQVHLIDGAGNFYEGTLHLVTEKKCTVKNVLGPKKQLARNYYLHLAIAPTKQIDRIEWLVEKAVEIGIDEFSFITCANSERTVLKKDRILKIAVSAVKQSLQAFIPKVNDLVSFKDLLNNNICDQRLIAHCFDLPRAELRTLAFSNRKTLALIGPEGDFTMEEVNLAVEKGFKPVSLGESRLRTETAGLYICQAAKILG